MVQDLWFIKIYDLKLKEKIVIVFLNMQVSRMI